MRCSHYVVDPQLQLIFWIVFWDFVETKVAVCVVAAFFVLDEALVAVLNRVVRMFAVGVVGSEVGGDVDARGKRNCAILHV